MDMIVKREPFVPAQAALGEFQDFPVLGQDSRTQTAIPIPETKEV